jgi:hypothetical protein
LTNQIEYWAFRLKNEGLSIEQISKTMNMPIDFVNESIEKYYSKRFSFESYYELGIRPESYG